MLPVISNCPECGSDKIEILSRSPATYEVFCQCGACGGDWWEEDQRETDAQQEADAIDAAYEAHRDDPRMEYLCASDAQEAA